MTVYSYVSDPDCICVTTVRGSRNATSLMLLILAQKELRFEIRGWVLGSETNHVSVGQNSSPQRQNLSVSAKMLQINILVRFPA